MPARGCVAGQGPSVSVPGIEEAGTPYSPDSSQSTKKVWKVSRSVTFAVGFDQSVAVTVRSQEARSSVVSSAWSWSAAGNGASNEGSFLVAEAIWSTPSQRVTRSLTLACAAG